jgi:hypothetical protein
MRRLTNILLVLFLLAGLVFWFMQQPGNPIKQAIASGTNTPSISQEPLVSPNQGPLSLVSITDSSGKTVKIDRSSGKWFVTTTDRETPADPSKAESAVGHALKLTILRKLDTPPNPAGTGLTDPQYKISLRLADGSTFDFQVGKPSATGNGYYVEHNGNVFILNKNDVDALLANFTDPPVQTISTEQPTGRP